MKLEIPTRLNVQSVTIISDRGELTWGRSVPNGFLLPTGPLKYRVTYNPGFSWPVDDSKPFDPDALPNQALVVGGLTKADMRTAVVGYQQEFDHVGLSMNWFSDTYLTVDGHAVPVAKRLILAWLDGQPDVPGAELLQLGGATSMEELWKRPPPFQSPKPVAYIERSEDKPVEPKIEKPKPEFVPPAFLVPGSTPGTWRMKEPPEGVLAQ